MTALIICIQEIKDAFSYRGKREKRNPLVFSRKNQSVWNRDNFFLSTYEPVVSVVFKKIIMLITT